MYSMVLMMAMTGSGDVTAFGGHKSAGCSGCSGVVVETSGCCGGRVGLFGRHKDKHGCSGCTGTVVAPTNCCGVETNGCCGGRHGLFGGGLFRKHKHGCSGCSGVVVPAGCSGASPMPAPAPAPMKT